MGNIIKFPIKQLNKLFLNIEICTLEDGSVWYRCVNKGNLMSFDWIKLEE